MLGKLCAAVLIAIPGFLVFFLPTFAASFSPKDHVNFPSKILAKGGAYISCDPPFNSALSQRQNESVNVECKISSAENVFHIRSTPSEKTKKDSDDSGVTFKLDKQYTQRFESKSIRIDISASCEGCTEPVEFKYATKIKGNSGWKPFALTPQKETVSFTYLNPDFPRNKITRQANFYVDPYKNPEDAIIRVHAISIYEVQ